MSEYLIEEGVPLPGAGKTKGEMRIALEKLEVGQSFLVANRKYGAVSSASACVAKDLRRKFAVRSLPEGIRVWRTS